MEEVNNDDTNIVTDDNTQTDNESNDNPTVDDTTPMQILAQKMIDHEPLDSLIENNTPNVAQTDIEPVTDMQVCSNDVFTDPDRNNQFTLNFIIQYDKKRYWDKVNNKKPLPFGELEYKYGSGWMRDSFYNDDNETLLHVYMTYSSDVPRNVWFRYFSMSSPHDGEALLDIALKNNTVPSYPFYEYLAGEDDEGEELLLAICPEAMDMSLTDLIAAVKEYKSKKS